MVFEFDRTFVERVENTLNPGDKGWSRFAASDILVHIEERKVCLWTCDLQCATEYEILVRFALAALRQSYDDSDFTELYDLVQEVNKIIEGAAYYAIISQNNRAYLYKITHTTDELIVDFIGASLP